MCEASIVVRFMFVTFFMNWCDVAHLSIVLEKGSDDRIKLNNFKIVSLNLGVLCFSIWLYPHLHHIIFCSWGISILYSICFLNFSSHFLNWAFKAFCSEFRLPFCIIFKCSIHFLPSTNGVTVGPECVVYTPLLNKVDLTPFSSLTVSVCVCVCVCVCMSSMYHAILGLN